MPTRATWRSTRPARSPARRSAELRGWSSRLAPSRSRRAPISPATPSSDCGHLVFEQPHDSPSPPGSQLAAFPARYMPLSRWAWASAQPFWPGALIVGSSVRESLRGLTLDRLGEIDFAAVGERYFRETATEAFSDTARAASAVLVRGSAEHAESSARASKVRIHGVDADFWAFYEIDAPEIGNREIVLNRRLAAELGTEEGDDLLLRFQTDSLIPAESVMGRKADNVRLLRLKVVSILDNTGPGRFGLSPQQQLPYNAFVSKPVLQRALEQSGRANALFVGGGTLEGAQAVWQESFAPQDARLVIRTPARGARSAR